MDVIVEAIFFAIKPDFPTPVIITLPLILDNIFIASVNLILRLADNLRCGICECMTLTGRVASLSRSWTCATTRLVPRAPRGSRR